VSWSAAEVTAVVAAGASTASAAAAWLGALANRRSVERAHRPFVWPDLEIRHSVGTRESWLDVRVRLHSDGPGTAFDVSCTIDPDLLPTAYRHPRRFSRPVASGRSTPPVRAMRPGTVVPAAPDDDEDGAFRLRFQSRGRTWWTVVRWTDAAGVRWESCEPSSPDALALPPRRVRRVRRPCVIACACAGPQRCGDWAAPPRPRPTQRIRGWSS
jgi:hypothetical protein